MGERTVLIVDDSAFARRIVRGIMESAHADWAIVEAASGEEALAKAAATPPHFVLIDMNMPGIDGLTAARQLLRDHPRSAIALLTANIQEPIRRQAAAAGIAFIAKPAKTEKILDFLDGSGRP